MDLSIIIVNWNTRPLLERCLESIFRAAGNLSVEIFVVDNASKDDSQEVLKKRFQGRVNLIFNEKNLGFAKANNQALKRAKGHFILFLNPDTEVLGDDLIKIVKLMRRNRDYGVVGCQLIGVDGEIQPSVRRFPTLISQILILLKLHQLFPQLEPLADYYAYDFDYRKLQEVDQVAGAFFMVRREVFEEVGLLDENFFIWFEEVDFCKRVKEAGWKVVYTPEVKILHHGAQSFGQVLPFRKQRIFNRSLIYYFKKHHSKIAIRILRCFSPISLFLAFLIQLIRVVTKSSGRRFVNPYRR